MNNDAIAPNPYNRTFALGFIISMVDGVDYSVSLLRYLLFNDCSYLR